METKYIIAIIIILIIGVIWYFDLFGISTMFKSETSKISTAAPTLLKVEQSPIVLPPPEIIKPSPPVKKCQEVDNIRLIGGGWYGKGGVDNGQKYGWEMSDADCQKLCLDDPNCKQYVYLKNDAGLGRCYSMVNEYGINKESLDKNFKSAWCNTDGRIPPTSI